MFCLTRTRAAAVLVLCLAVLVFAAVFTVYACRNNPAWQAIDWLYF